MPSTWGPPHSVSRAETSGAHWGLCEESSLCLSQWVRWCIYVQEAQQALTDTEQVGFCTHMAFVSTHPTSKIDLLCFTAWARHFPPSLVILFFPSLQRELCPCQPLAVRGLSHPQTQHRAPLVPLGRCGLSPGTHSSGALRSPSGKDPRPGGQPVGTPLWVMCRNSATRAFPGVLLMTSEASLIPISRPGRFSFAADGQGVCSHPLM